MNETGSQTMKSKRYFQGTGTALVTPFKKDGAVDEAALRKLVRFQLKGTVEALVPCGTTGESPTLTHGEQERVIAIVVEESARKVKVFAGAGGNNTQEVIEKAKSAKRIGADAILSVGPYYNKPTQEGFFQHFHAIAEKADLDIIVYNIPGRTGSNIEAGTILRMAEEIPHVVGVKEASGNLAQMMEIAHHRPPEFSLLSGDDSFTLPLVALGGDGVISTTANQVPRLFSDMTRACLNGDWEKARRLHYKLLHLMNANFLETNPIPVKAGLAMMGMIEEVYRLPLVPIGDKAREKLRKALRELGLLGD
jgi:4-hydroxy-tetrahydrodipicolinate synthase